MNKLIAWLSRHGITLANDATEDQLATALAQLDPKLQTAAGLDAAREQFANERKARIDSELASALRDGRITEAERPIWQQRLANETQFTNELAALVALKPALKTHSLTLDRGDRKIELANAANRRHLVAEVLAEIANELDLDLKHAAITTAPGPRPRNAIPPCLTRWPVPTPTAKNNPTPTITLHTQFEPVFTPQSSTNNHHPLMKLNKSIRRLLLKTPIAPVQPGLCVIPHSVLQIPNSLSSPTSVRAHTKMAARLISPDVVTTQRWLLYMRGSDTNHCTVATAGASPLGPSDDQADESDIPITINLLGAVKGTVRVITDGTINDGSYVKCGASGVATAATTGDVSFGIAVIPTDCTKASGDTITIIPMAPAKYQF